MESTSETGGRLTFASPAWIEAARRILEVLVAAHGEDGRCFRVSERFTGAPPEVAPSGIAAWHFAIDGKSVIVGVGELADADMSVDADYAAALPSARLVYTPEILARRAARRPKASPHGGAKMPAYLIELHNRLAVITV